MRTRTSWLPVIAIACAMSFDAAHAADRADVSARLRLYQQQLQASLDLSLQQSLARAPGLSVRDRLELDRLSLAQRMAQQALQQQQLTESRRFADDALRLRMQGESYRQEAELQRQHFYVEQQRLLGSIQRAPLQPAAPPGTLVLP